MRIEGLRLLIKQETLDTIPFTAHGRWSIIALASQVGQLQANLLQYILQGIGNVHSTDTGQLDEWNKLLPNGHSCVHKANAYCKVLVLWLVTSSARMLKNGHPLTSVTKSGRMMSLAMMLMMSFGVRGEMYVAFLRWGLTKCSLSIESSAANSFDPPPPPPPGYVPVNMIESLGCIQTHKQPETGLVPKLFYLFTKYAYMKWKS